MNWIVTTNTNDCRIYQCDEKQKRLTLMEEINHPQNREKASIHLTTDKPGHYQAGSVHGAYAPHSDPKAVQIDDFAHLIANTLNEARNKNVYSKLMIITPAHMSGLIAQHLNKHVAALITHTIHKDVMHLNEQELIGLLNSK